MRFMQKLLEEAGTRPALKDGPGSAHQRDGMEITAVPMTSGAPLSAFPSQALGCAPDCLCLFRCDGDRFDAPLSH